MATCKDCICYDILCQHTLQEDELKLCESFKNKAEYAEVKHGKWIYNTDDFSPKMRCSVCGYNKPLVAGVGIEQEPNDYCNKCGAKMDGEMKTE